MTSLKQQNEISKKLGYENFAHLKQCLGGDSHFSQLISANDIINSLLFLQTQNKTIILCKH